MRSIGQGCSRSIISECRPLWLTIVEWSRPPRYRPMSRSRHPCNVATSEKAIRGSMYARSLSGPRTLCSVASNRSHINDMIRSSLKASADALRFRQQMLVIVLSSLLVLLAISSFFYACGSPPIACGASHKVWKHYQHSNGKMD